MNIQVGDEITFRITGDPLILATVCVVYDTGEKHLDLKCCFKKAWFSDGREIEYLNSSTFTWYLKENEIESLIPKQRHHAVTSPIDE